MQQEPGALRKASIGKASPGKASPGRNRVKVTQQALVNLNQVDLFNNIINGSKGKLVL